MTESVIVLFRSCIVLIFGESVSFLLTGVKHTWKNNLAIAFFYLLLFIIQIVCWQMFGLQTTMKLYPFITHLPTVLFATLYFKHPWSITVSSVLTAYLCCQIPKWIGYMSAAIFGGRFTEHVAYFIAMIVVYFLLKNMWQNR